MAVAGVEAHRAAEVAGRGEEAARREGNSGPGRAEERAGPEPRGPAVGGGTAVPRGGLRLVRGGGAILSARDRRVRWRREEIF